ncbi:MAG: IS3 family transposase, partial [Pseudomonadota bacterium]|nr:IS3 family transposase [Pseudomonadota bacterium]
MKQYSEEFKSSIIAKLLPPNNVSVPELARDTGIPKDTLYCWRLKHRRPTGHGGAEKVPSGNLSSTEKFSIVLETASLNEVELSEYCRRKGLYPEQIGAWRDTCTQANAAASAKVDRARLTRQAKQIRQLEVELRRKEKALAEAAALLVLQKKVPRDLGGNRGRKIDLRQRREVITCIDAACQAGARLSRACRVVAISPRTLQRWRADGEVKADGRQAAGARRTPANKLSDQERRRILDLVNEPAFAHLPPSQIVPALADQGRYVASESSFYRVLREADQLAHRGKAKAPRHYRPQPLQASAPNQLWSWDITYLATTVHGIFFYLYLIMDVFSRKIVGWEVFASESAEQAAQVFRKAYLHEEIAGNLLRLHSDNGSPMKGATMLSTLQWLGVMPSFSRPSVSDDNPYSEALFKTLKYHPCYPDKPFDNLQEAREWVAGFQHWYNEVHRHSALKFVTPAQRHRGEDSVILEQRHALYQAAKIQHPERWSGPTRNWEPEEIVYLNPGKPITKEVHLTQKAA